ncbi:MAG TPA: SPOR domain-containing protein [Steroidobacteraceae bacterium]|jgi:cell division protein FtsN|nr:SPOR domain-containing protein [Steroidobacteraceae bacterium]
MVMNKAFLGLCIALLLGICGCSRQQSDWEKTRAANTTDSYEQFLKKYPNGEFTAQAQARVKELYEERDWQKARDADTQEAYQAFLKQYPEGKWTEEARIRVENFTLAQAPSSATPAGADSANTSASPVAGGATASSKPPAAPKPPAAAAPASAPAPATPSTKIAAAGSYGVQLGAFKSSADAANQRWAHLDKEYPKLLAGLSPTVAPKKTDSGTLYRLQVAGLTEKHARAICKSLKEKSQACVILHPAH